VSGWELFSVIGSVAIALGAFGLSIRQHFISKGKDTVAEAEEKGHREEKLDFLVNLVSGIDKKLEKQDTKIEGIEDNHNLLFERVVIVEQSDKSAHKRIDELKIKVDKIGA